MCRYCEYKPEKLELRKEPELYRFLSDKQVKKLGFERIYGQLLKIDNPNPSINFELSENGDFHCSMNVNIHIKKNGKFYFNGRYSESDRSLSPDFKDRATGFKFCPMCGRKLVKNKK